MILHHLLGHLLAHLLVHLLVHFVVHVDDSRFWTIDISCLRIFVSCCWSNNWSCALPGDLEVLGCSVAWIANEAIGEALR